MNTQNPRRKAAPRATLWPTRHPPGTPGKVAEMALRVSQGLPPCDPRDAKLHDEPQPDSYETRYYPGELEQLRAKGLIVHSEVRGNQQVITGTTTVDRSGAVVGSESRDLPEGRTRTEAERARAADQEFKQREAARKRAARAAKRRAA